MLLVIPRDLIGIVFVRIFWVGKERVFSKNSISLKNATLTAEETDLDLESETEHQIKED